MCCNGVFHYEWHCNIRMQLDTLPCHVAHLVYIVALSVFRVNTKQCMMLKSFCLNTLWHKFCVWTVSFNFLLCSILHVSYNHSFHDHEFICAHSLVIRVTVCHLGTASASSTCAVHVWCTWTAFYAIKRCLVCYCYWHCCIYSWLQYSFEKLQLSGFVVILYFVALFQFLQLHLYWHWILSCADVLFKHYLPYSFFVLVSSVTLYYSAVLVLIVCCSQLSLYSLLPPYV